jgi:hypothetical protein
MNPGDIIQVLDPRAGWQDRIFVRWHKEFVICSYPNMTWKPELYLNEYRIKRS